MSSYSNYDAVKAGAYSRNARLHKWAVAVLPRVLLERVFPVIGFLRARRDTSVLDIGAGSGLYSHILRSKYHCNCTEIEPYMTNLFGANDCVIRAEINKLPLGRKFDTILLIDVLEHLTDGEIDSLFLGIPELLNQCGRVFIKVPNASSLAGIESSVGDLTHVQHFNAISLSALIGRYRFELVRMRGVGPNVTPRRLLLRMLSAPFDLFISLHLKARGCSGVLLAPAIMAEFQSCP